ncbi:MAG: acetyltransferase [Siculibacillus sp.]|nr:acetyltransferase [Siculibacillus sp.]
MSKRVFGLFGTGGFARETMPLAMRTLGREKPPSIGDFKFVDREAADPLNGLPVQAEDDFFAADGLKFFNIAIAEGELRRKIATRAIERGAIPLALIAPNTTIYDENVLGEGAIICANSMITSNATIGRFFHMNIYSYVAHDCVIGDFVTFAPRVCCNGNVVVEDGVYIGTAAILRQGRPGKPLRIGAGAVIGMGAVVTKDVPPGVTVVGNPARPLEKKGD